MVLLESDLEEHFGLSRGEKDKVAKHDIYEWLCTARDKCHAQRCRDIEENLVVALQKDQSTHRYSAGSFSQTTF